MFIKRARPRASVRSRDTEDDAPTTPSDGDSAMEESGSVMERKKATRKKTQGRSKLSFGADEEGSDSPAFKQKKSLLSQALKASSAVTPSAAESPSYSREYLSELKASTPTRAPKTEGEGLSAVAQDKYATQIAADTTAGIPDPIAVAAAKSRRKAALEGRPAREEDYISLGSDRGPHPESRLMREEDEGDEGDEDFAMYTGANDRLALGKDATRSAARRLKGVIGEMIDEREEEESDEETREWEQTLVARGGQAIVEVEEKVRKEQPKKSAQAAPIPQARPIPSVTAAEARIAARIAELEVTKVESEAAVESATRDLVSLEEQERDIRKQVEEEERKREWIEGFQGWVETLGGFLEEKMPQLEEVEEDQFKFLRERAALISKRRLTDDADDLALFLGAPGNATSADDIEASRPNSEVRRSRRKDREDRRARRLGIVAAAEDHEEGFSTDSDLEGDVADDYEAAQRDLDRRVHSLMEDVMAEDFRDPTKGLAVRFADWRKRYPEDYNAAYGGLALVQAWEFWARGEMVGWEPVRSNTTMDSFSWFKALFTYSRPPADLDDDDMDLEPEVGEEGDLTVEMVCKVVLPWLIKALQNGAYDPYSAGQTRRAVDLLEFIGDMSNGTKEYDALCKSLTKTVLGLYQAHALELASAIASATMPGSVPPPPYNPTARSAMQRFARRRMKLLRNLLLWRRIAPDEVQDLTIRFVNLLRGPFKKTWEGGGDEMAQKILSIPNLRLSSELQNALRQP